MWKQDVKIFADNIYSLLCIGGKATLRKIEQLIDNKECVLLSLGWLLRDNKVVIHNDNKEWYFEIKETYREMYY